MFAGASDADFVIVVAGDPTHHIKASDTKFEGRLSEREINVYAAAGNFRTELAKKYADRHGAFRITDEVVQSADPRSGGKSWRGEGPRALVRRLLAGAFLLGGNVTVRAGQVTGGDFQHVPLCTVPGQFGCVVAYSTFSTDPSPGISFFGNTNTDLLSPAFGEPHGAGYQVACTDPGPLSGASGPFSIMVPTKPFPPGFIAVGVVGK